MCQIYRHFDRNRKKGYHATTLEVSVPHQSLALFCAFTTIIIRIGCCIAAEMLCTSYEFFRKKPICTKSFENIREGLFSIIMAFFLFSN